jgi:hypothetical protein
MNPSITELLDKPDNIEKIRDRIALILKMECANQYEKAQELHLENAGDYAIGVYLEHSRPWQLTENSQGKNPFPLANVQALGYKRDIEAGGETVNRKKYIAEFAIDCYANGVPDHPEYGDDTDSTIRAWRLAGIIRKILMSGFYTYLGMRDVVRRREISETQTGSPTDRTGNIDESAISVTICRILISVWFHEESPQAAVAEFEGISFKSPAPNGEVLLDI